MLTKSQATSETKSAMAVRFLPMRFLLCPLPHAGWLMLFAVIVESWAGPHPPLPLMPAPLPRPAIDLSALVYAPPPSGRSDSLGHSDSPRQGPTAERAQTIQAGSVTLKAALAPELPQPALGVRAPPIVLWGPNSFETPVRLHVASNYAHFAKIWQILVYRAGDALRARLVTMFSGPVKKMGEGVFWDGLDDEGRAPRPGETFLLVARLIDNAGNADASRPVPLSVWRPYSKKGENARELAAAPFLPRALPPPARRSIPLDTRGMVALRLSLTGGTRDAPASLGGRLVDFDEKGESRFTLLLPTGAASLRFTLDGHAGDVLVTSRPRVRRFLRLPRALAPHVSPIEQAAAKGRSPYERPIGYLAGRAIIAETRFQKAEIAAALIAGLDPNGVYAIYRDDVGNLLLPIGDARVQDTQGS